MIEATVGGIEAGKTKGVVAGLKGLREEFKPTYEGRVHYDELVAKFVREMQKGEN